MRGELDSAQIPLQEKLLATALKAIKHLAASPPLIEVLQNSNAMEVLVSLLGKTMKEDKKVVSAPRQLCIKLNYLGNQLPYLPDYLVNDQAVQSSPRRSSFSWNHSIAQKSHQGHFSTRSIRSTDLL